MKRIFDHKGHLLIILIFSILGMKALFHPGLFTAHDIWHQVVRLYYYSQAINDGQFPPSWIGQLANGFGYPLFLFSYQLPWLISIPLFKIGLNIPDTIKALFFLSYLGSGITMYAFVNNLLKSKPAALLSSILYLWLPYHFLIIFVGGSMGIAFIFTFLPLMFLGINLIKEQSKLGIPIFAIGFGTIILSHVMHLIFALPAISIFSFWAFFSSKDKTSFLKNTVLGLILGLLISAFYLIPAAYYNNSTRIHQESGFYELYKRNFVNFNQLLYSKWGYGPIINNAKEGVNSFQLGFVQWFSILGLILLIILGKISKSQRSLSITMLLIFTVSIFLMLDYSKFVWSFFMRFVVIDFPYRMLLPAAFIASLCASIVFVNFSKKIQRLFMVLLIFVAFYTNRNHLNVNQYTNFPISTYLNIETERTTNTYNEYLPLQAEAKLLNKPWNEAVGENLSASNTKQTTNSLSFDLSTPKEASASIGQFYFPGQTLYLDNKIIHSNVDKEGRINFIAPAGIHKVMITYQDTNIIKLSKYLTAIGILLILFLFFRAGGHLREYPTFN